MACKNLNQPFCIFSAHSGSDTMMSPPANKTAEYHLSNMLEFITCSLLLSILSGLFAKRVL